MTFDITNPLVNQQDDDPASEKKQAKGRPIVEEVQQLIRSFDLGPVNYDQTEDEILGYGPDGIPE